MSFWFGDFELDQEGEEITPERFAGILLEEASEAADALRPPPTA